MIYIIGDMHANQNKWLRTVEPVLSDGDFLIVCGDFGIGFWNGKYWSEELFFDYIEQQKYTVLFVDGNHENFNKLEEYTVEEKYGGKVHAVRRNLYHLIRGEIYIINEVSFFTFGGGYSIDRTNRIKNISWWEHEMPTEEEYRHALENLSNSDNKVDYIITHTAPTKTVIELCAIYKDRLRGDVYQELPLTNFFEKIASTVIFKQWYFGHLHIDRNLSRNQTAVFETMHKIEAGEKIEKEKRIKK